MAERQEPSRRDFFKTTGAAVAATAVGLGAPSGAALAAGAGTPSTRSGPGGQMPAAPGSGHPNVLFMMVDEMRYPPIYETAVLGRFRAQFMKTQNALRATGVEFHRHYAASTACAPSRTSIFTGQYPSLHGVTQTTGAAKEANDPDVFWLDPDGVPTIGDYFQAAGFRSFYRGKWHVSNADLQIPGTHDQIVSYTDTGAPDPEKERLYRQADRLSGYGFEGWIGPEPHGKDPLNTGSSPSGDRRGRDAGFAQQTVDLIEWLDANPNRGPWFMVSSFVNPHDIALWGFAARALGVFDFSVDDDVPGLPEIYDRRFEASLLDDLSTKPSAQRDYQQTYNEWMQGIPPRDYWRFYYQLHKEVDAEMFKVYEALRASSFFDDTIVVYTSDHGDLLGSHGYMHQKWHNAYDESLRVPLFISNPNLVNQRAEVHSLTSHVDLLPTMLGLAGLDPADYLRDVAAGHTDAVMPVGRDLTPLVDGRADAVSDPIFFMTDDEPSRGLNQENIFGVAYDSIGQPNHIETVIVEIEGEVWKYTRYFDNPQFWSDTDPLFGDVKDVVINVRDGENLVAGTFPIAGTKRVKFEPVPDEYEMYNVTNDPIEVDNLYGKPEYAEIQAQLASLLDQQREQKRLTPISGEVPLQP